MDKLDRLVSDKLGRRRRLRKSTLNLTGLNLANLTADSAVFTDDILAINSSTFPDANFRSYVSSNFDTDNSSGLSESELYNVFTISVADSNISDLTGIGNFTNLQTLNCSNNKLTSLNLSNNTKLNTLYCNDNSLTSLNITGCTALATLCCSSNNLNSINLTQNTQLQTLDCSNNNLSSLSLKNYTKLEELDCYENALSSLDVTGCSKLNLLWCYSNKLTNLTLTGTTGLEVLYCYSNNLSSLNLTSCTSLRLVRCHDNSKLSQINVSNSSKLTEVWINKGTSVTGASSSVNIYDWTSSGLTKRST